jgi:hypothetical protein
MDKPFDRALARAADGPDARVDLDEVAAIARRRRRRRRVLAGVGVALVVAAAPAAVIAAGGLSGDDTVVLAPKDNDTTSPPPADDTDAADTPRGRAAVELELRDQQVPRCGTVSLRQHNTGEVGLTTGKPMGLQRWTGTAWRDVSPLPPGHAWPLIQLSVSPGEASSWQDLDLGALDHIEPGWYRINKTVDVDPDSGSGDPNRDQPSLEVATVVEVVSDPRRSEGDCGPSTEQLTQREPADEANADVDGDDRSDHVELHARQRGVSVLVETADGDLAAAWLGSAAADFHALGSRALPDDRAGLDLTGSGRDEILVRHEDGPLDELMAVAWHDGALDWVHERSDDLSRWILASGPDENDQTWLSCTDRGVRQHRVSTGDGRVVLQTRTFRLIDGEAHRIDQTQRDLAELPDITGPTIDCDR